MTDGGSTAKDIFLAALELETDERAVFVERTCGDDESLRARVDELLGAHGSSEALDGWLGKGLDVDPLASTDEGRPIGSLGDYELIEKIESGAMGTVYRARQKSLDRIVALKVLRVGRFATEEEVRRFRAEAEGAAQLDHPNIVPVYEVGEEQRRNFFSMKLIDGPSLGAVALRDDPRRAAELVAAVARGVHHAHQHGLLHRDLKPSNILLDAEGTPHVADFGVAKRLGEDAFDTDPGVIAGTPAYMAPEQLKADGKVTVRTDVYALGCVLYELLTGEAPFAGRSIAEVFHDVLDKEAPAVTSRNPAVPRDLSIICHGCLSKDPDRRYGSMLELAEDLERWLDHLPIRARPTSTLERLRLYGLRKPVQASLSATVALLVVVLAIGATATSFVLREYLNRAIGAESTAKERLRTALLAQARANLRADRPGRRHESLELLAQAARIEPGPDLRDEAVKAMTLTDLRNLHRWNYEEGERAIAWDFERDRVAIATRDGACQVRTFDGALLTELPAVEGQAWGGLFSTDGRLLVVKYHGNKMHVDPLLCVWDLPRREIVFREARELPNQSLQFHPDGRTLLVGSAGNEVALLDLDELRLRPFFESENHPGAVAFRPDGSEVAATLYEPPRIEFRSYPDGEARLFVDCEWGPMTLDWSPSGKHLVVGAGDSNAYVLDGGTGETLLALEGHQAEVVLVHFLAEELVVTTSWDETTRLWDLRSGKTLILAEDAVRARSRDGRLLGFTNRARGGVWAVDHGDLFRVFHGHELKGPRWVAVSPSGRWMATGGDDDTLLWSLEGECLLGSLETGKIGGLHFGRERDVLYATTERGLFRWTFEEGCPDPLAVEPELLFDDLTWRFGVDASETVFVAAVDEEVQLRDLDRPERNRVLGGFHGMNRLCVSADGSRAAAGSWRGRGVRVWNLESGEVELDLLGEYAETTVAFSPDGGQLITGTPDDYRSWRVGTWEPEWRLPRELQPTNLPGTIAFDARGELLAIAASTRVMWLLDPRSGELLLSLDAAESHPLTRASFLPAGRGLATATSGRRVFLWNLERVRAGLGAYGLDHGLDAWPRGETSPPVTR